MTGFLLDTDVVIELLRGRPNTVFRLSAIPSSPVFLSAVVVGEILEGFARKSQTPATQTTFNSYLNRYTVLPFDIETARVFAAIQSRLLGSGQPIGDADVMIAATAIQHDLTLITGNIRHFSRIQGLTLLP